MHAIVVEQLGGPEELRVAERPTPQPGLGEIRVEVSVAGVNFMDTGTRRFGPPTGRLPVVPGVEGAGRVSALGDGVTEFAVGDRVSWVYAYGSYAEQLVLPAESAVPVPDDISDEVAASVMMQGITAHHFATEAKAQIAHQVGADHFLVSTGDAFVEPVLELTDGDGVHTVFDGGGETTFRASLRVLRRNGTLLHYGAVIGAAPVVNLRELPRSVKICYPVFRDHIPTHEALLRHSAEIFRMVQNGRLRVEIEEAAG
ncbi:MAG TPA: zinc-binding dehydrogenase [Pseudonocardiaceae bacterium]|nr:zinc-binding dehydrogenase [Pseudonocardiaceae bacterium]